tara:strand:- start:3506 stop:4555 length:1050 start_codon:yes stop_codon:yes gene_type:complete
MKNLFKTLKIKKLANGGPITPDDINDLFPDEGFQFTPYSGQDENLNNLLIEFFGTNYQKAFPYLSEYDTTSEELASLQRQQSDFESGQQLDRGISSAQSQIGSSLANMYAQGRSGQSSFGGTTLPGVIRRNLMSGYGDIRSGLEEDYQTALTDSALAEATSIQSARDRYQSDITNMLTVLQDIIEYSEDNSLDTDGDGIPDNQQTYGGGSCTDIGGNNVDCNSAAAYYDVNGNPLSETGGDTGGNTNPNCEAFGMETDVDGNCYIPINTEYNPGNWGSSDVKLKKNVVKVGKSKSGLNIYEFDYINKKYGEGRYRGVMAQEVPHAAILDNSGYYMVDYNKVDVNFERIA